MKLSKLLHNVELCSSFNEAEIEHISCDSRSCTKGSLFMAVRGADTDGHTYINKAIENGATHIVCEEIPADMLEKATVYHDKILKLMNDIRKYADSAESVVPADYWPYPSYGEMLFNI